jgi:predicted outer membrane repeat protein
LALATGIQAKTVYVNADGTSDFPTIGAAVRAVGSGDVIVLEQGTYFGFDNQDITVRGKALTLRSRDPNNPAIVAKTVIDGQGNRTTWSTHWAIGAETSGTHLTLAGLTICNCFEVGSGGAVRCQDADLDAINCTFRDNTSQIPGGAVYCGGSHAQFVGCTFSNSVSEVLHGGAVYGLTSQLDFVNCSFEASTGCALETYDCQVTLIGCTFQNNKGRDGGAIRSQADTDPNATRLTLTHCTFTTNSASTCGGAIYNYGAQTTITACTFTSNTASQDGGAIYNYQSSPAVASCLFVGNTATGAGGAVQNLNSSSPDIINCTFVANSAASGGAMTAKGGSNPLLSHSILWGNTATQGASVYVGSYQWSSVQVASATVEYCDVEGGRGSADAESGCTLTWDSASNSSRDPLFTGSAGGDYHLAPDSPCINAGDPAYAPKAGQTDLDGAARRLGSAVDLGAYEFQGLGPVYRFWSPTKGKHFYTISGSERDSLMNQHAGDWQFETIAFYAFYVQVVDNLLPVYRFASTKLDTHFWTISQDERDNIIRNWPEVWTYESVAFYAYPEGRQPLGTLPVYRFWSNLLGSHFYTMDEDEKNEVIRDYPSVWTFEGVAWYAYATSRLPQGAAYAFTGGSQEARYALTLSAYVDGKEAQISLPDVKLSTSSTWMQMTIDFGKQTTTLDGLRVQAAVTSSSATIKQSGSGVTIPLALSVQGSFEVATPQGPYTVDPETNVFADFTKANQNLTIKDPIFKYSGSAQIGDQNKSFDCQVVATRLELEASGTFEAINLLPEEINARMPFTFQWHRQNVKDLLAQATVSGHVVQLYVTSADISTQGLWKGSIAK